MTRNTGPAARLAEKAANRFEDLYDTHTETFDRVERAVSGGTGALAFGALGVAVATRRLMRDPQRVAARLPTRRRIAGVGALGYTAAVLYGRTADVPEAWKSVARNANLVEVLSVAAVAYATTHVTGAVIGDRDQLPLGAAAAVAVTANGPAIVRQIERARRERSRT